MVAVRWIVVTVNTGSSWVARGDRYLAGNVCPHHRMCPLARVDGHNGLVRPKANGFGPRSQHASLGRVLMLQPPAHDEHAIKRLIEKEIQYFVFVLGRNKRKVEQDQRVWGASTSAARTLPDTQLTTATLLVEPANELQAPACQHRQPPTNATLASPQNRNCATVPPISAVSRTKGNQWGPKALSRISFPF